MSINNRYDALKRLHQLFSDKKWIFAKTMPQNPHEYTLRKHWENEDDFVEAVELIRQYGYKTKFKGNTYTQFNVLGHFYWSMGAPVPITILINRACTDKDIKNPYDAISESYDDWFRDPKYLQEDRDLANLLSPFISVNTLDIGCGTGLLIDLTQVSASNYFGIDPSRGMLARLKTKYPEHRVSRTKYEDFPFEGFDSIVSLYGSLNYCNPDSVAQIIEQLNTGGKYFLMLLKEDYSPVTHDLANVAIPFNKFSSYVFPEDSLITEFSNYIIVSGVK